MALVAPFHAATPEPPAHTHPVAWLEGLVSKYPLIKATLKSRLLTGQYREGEAMPSEAQLALEFHVSRMTARRAVDELEREGYVYRVQGSGSYPTGKRFRQGVFRIRSLEELAGDGLPFTRVLRADLAHVETDVAAALGLGAGGAAFEIVRLRGLEDGPVLLERRFVRAEHIESLERSSLAGESIHDLLVGQLGLEIVRVEQSLEAVCVTPDEAQLLEVPVGTACFLMRRTSFTALGPVSFARYWVRSDRGAFVSAFEP